MRKILECLLLLMIPCFTYSQKGKITGKVTSSITSEALVGASVQIRETGRTTITDLNGNYSFSNLADGTYSIICSYVSYNEKFISNIKVDNTEPFVQNIILEPATQKSKDVVIKGGRVNKENTIALLIAQKNSASVSDGISAEIIRKTPDRNTSDILKRVSGASIQEDKFAIIRGLNDRYNTALLNGATLPSTESDRKAFSFDIFPANMLDNLVIYKTATPDLPAELGGGVILINTKDIPSKSFQSVSGALGYNTLATFRERQFYQGGKLDFLGVDDGSRALSDKIPAAGSFPTTPQGRQFLGFYIPNNWRIIKGYNFLNTNIQYVRGWNIQRKQHDFLGILLSVTHSRSYTHNNGTRRSNEYDRLNPSDSSILRARYNEDFFVAQTLAGAIANFSMKLNSNNIFSFKNLYSINADDKIIIREGVNDATSDPNSLSRAKARWFTSNQIYSGQLSGEHFITRIKTKINWIASYTNVRRDIPNLRKTLYGKNDFDTIYKASVPALIPETDNGGTIFYASTKESIKNVKADITRSFSTGKNIQHTFKAGVAYQLRERNFAARQLGLVRYSVPGSVTFDNTLLALPEEKIFDHMNMGRLYNGKGGFILGDATKPSDHYTASSELFAAYAMMDQRLWKTVRLIYGVRMENFTQKLDALQSINDTVRLHTNKVDVLPSGSIVISLNSKQNLRLCYSKTLNRPEYRELAPFAFYDFVTRYTVSGRPDLKRAVIDNYDLRYEFYPGRGQLLSVSGFYKKFTDPIEQATVQGTDRQIIYNNVPEAENVGGELEFRTLLGPLFKAPEKSLLSRLTLFSNIAIIKSKVKLTTDTSTANIIRERPLQGQSPYVFNAGMIYQDDDKGLTFTLSANRIGQRIFIVGDENQSDVWENGRTVLDLQIAKTIQKGKLRNLELKMNVKDILAEKQVFFEDISNDKKYTPGKDNIWATTSFGRVISVSATYKF